MTSFFSFVPQASRVQVRLPHCLNSSSTSDHIGEPPTGYCCLSVLCALTGAIHSCLLSFSCQPLCTVLFTILLTMISPQDVSVDSHQNTRVVSIPLRQTKADPFGTGVTINLGRMDHVICPVTALLDYLALRGQDPGPLFLFKDGSTLSKARLLSSIRTALAMHGLDTRQLMGHSFCIGVATAAARAGLEDSLIQSLGRW